MKRSLLPAVSLVLALAASGCSLLPGGAGGADGSVGPGSSQGTGSGASAQPGPEQIAGIVATESGSPVFGARVQLGQAAAVTDGDGRFIIDRPDEDSLVTVTTDGAYGYAPVDAQGYTGAEELEVTMHSAPAGARTIRFGGEVRTGRSLLPQSAGPAAYVQALAGVAPLLELAESAAVTLATPLLDDPWADGADASSALLADALAASGVDVVALGTDRIADAGARGIRETQRILDEAGLLHAGAGEDLDEAWQPATIDANGAVTAYLSCQIGDADAPWTAREDRPGAAVCAPTRLERAIRTAGRDDTSVVVLLRDDEPYTTVVTDEFSSLVKTAVRAGATAIIGGGTHVAGEVWDFGDATAVQSLGDLLSDDATWQSRDGFLLRVDVDGRQTVAVSAEPITRSDGVPSPVQGDLAEDISRIAAGDINDGPLVLARDLAVVGSDAWIIDQATVSAEPDQAGPALELGAGWWIPPAGQQGVSVGYDLTPTGTFEDVDADPATDGAIGWFLGPGAELVAAPDDSVSADDDAGSAGDDARRQVCEGRLAVRLEPGDGRPATLFTAGTIPLRSVEGLSAYALVRDLGEGPLRGRLELQWFDGERQVGADSVDLEALDSLCGRLSLDTVPPRQADSVRPVLSVSRGAAVVDDLHVLGWMPERRGGRRWSHIRVFEPRQVTLVVDAPRDGDTPEGPFAAQPAS